ncbi:MAG TPA: glyoxylate/hydroxypyruvate reductase A [Leucothrix mucor]|uniref:Glyoxylate/hydroxypyruvate reductase A n=1 Tax=Leucothrix mucor TaxID=45248 RepID=A0A7V2SZ10_LEUMU|nr:glyoxylate/hydroxypyruvate reductase A [Leucothrix mucor]
MKEITTFVGQISSKNKEAWLNKINPLLTNITIIPYEDLTHEQKLDIKVAIVANPDPKELLELKNLLWVQSLWAGVERLLTELPQAEFGIVRMVDPNLSSTMAEAVLAWTFYLHRDMPKYRLQQKNKIWQQNELIEPKERNVGILGLGNLGRASAEKLFLNGFNTYGWSKNQANIQGVKCFSGATGLEEMLKQTDILICLLPLTDETDSLLSYENLGLLPHRASLINFSRGEIVDDKALLKHLNSRHLKHAVLDVFNTEPLPKNSDLWKSPSITILPHISAPTNIRTASKLVVHNLRQYFETGKIPETVVRSRGY